MKQSFQKTPLDIYRELAGEGKLELNPAQEEVLIYLTYLQNEIIKRDKLSRIFLGAWWKKWRRPPRGLYLWGGIGIGKTLLMDCFYQSLPVRKLRLHFYSFMRRLHQQLKEFQGQVNPLEKIGRKIAKEYCVICFDEFLVENMADAMLLGELLKTLFAEGICLVATSNSPPRELYRFGLNRERFIPAIEKIEQNMEIKHLNILKDYRRFFQSLDKTYFSPFDQDSEGSLQTIFRNLTLEHSVSVQPVMIFNRMISVKQRSDKVSWFEFTTICGRPRSQQDYLVLSEEYPVIIISHVPILSTVSTDLLISFIHMVDVFYDAGTLLLISAEAPILQLYPQGKWR